MMISFSGACKAPTAEADQGPKPRIKFTANMAPLIIKLFFIVIPPAYVFGCRQTPRRLPVNPTPGFVFDQQHSPENAGGLGDIGRHGTPTWPDVDPTSTNHGTSRL
jgi:hypothetical protein